GAGGQEVADGVAICGEAWRQWRIAARAAASGGAARREFAPGRALQDAACGGSARVAVSISDLTLFGAQATPQVAQARRIRHDIPMNIFATFEERVRDVLIALREEGALPPDAKLDGFVVEPPRESSHGDLATNAAMVLAKSARRNPRELGSLIAGRLASAPD